MVSKMTPPPGVTYQDIERQHRMLLTALVAVHLPAIREACFNNGLAPQAAKLGALISATNIYLKDTQAALDAGQDNSNDTVTNQKETIQ
jgi:hypothetical protein